MTTDDEFDPLLADRKVTVTFTVAELEHFLSPPQWAVKELGNNYLNGWRSCCLL